MWKALPRQLCALAALFVTGVLLGLLLTAPATERAADVVGTELPAEEPRC